jgi:hypothetical protein
MMKPVRGVHVRACSRPQSASPAPGIQLAAATSSLTDACASDRVAATFTGSQQFTGLPYFVLMNSQPGDSSGGRHQCPDAPTPDNIAAVLVDQVSRDQQQELNVLNQHAAVAKVWQCKAIVLAKGQA